MASNSSATMFGVGKLLGNAGLKKIGGPKVDAVDQKLKSSGIVGVAAIRMLPIAPFSLVNLVAGISSIGLFQFLMGTFLGMELSRFGAKVSILHMKSLVSISRGGG